ncbi:uncharacterized protein LOC129568212 [Sitodiplosis mosellana]|uniref:uncharacterized protein LOC129568212 n=1 Tax=Sitodiplosis mosellana TaxID=263140 RepID=UPI002444431A|nr:uncharacterized protein LOC129568212 [Sitodiplosis mosellana]
MGRRKMKKKMPPAKKTASPKGSSERKSLKVTSLNDKCLLKICAYLEIDDLAHLAASCKRFIPVCMEIFEKQYQKMHFPIRVYEIYDEDKFERYENMFTYFGKFIKKLRVEFDSSDHRDNKDMHNLIVEYCSATLTELHFIEMDKRMAIYRRFPRLTHLTLTQCHLSATVSHFEKWCPNLRSLELEMVQSVTNTACIERPLPKLEHFGLVNFIDCNFSNKNVRRFIKNNPQLKGLRLCRDIFGMALKITTEYISYIDQMLPNLEALDVIYTHRSAPPACVHSNNIPPKFSNLKCLQMTCRSADTLSAFMIPSKLIEKLSVDIEQGASESNLGYIMNCKELKSLTWCLNKENEVKNVFKLSKNPAPLPRLTDLKLYVVYGLNEKSHKRCQVLISIIDFMVHHKQLNSIVVGFQMTDNNKKFQRAEIACCENCSKFVDTDQESSDDNSDGDEEAENSTPPKNVADLGEILHPFTTVVEHKFNGAWKATFYIHKMPNKLIPVIEDVFICVAFKKNLIN